VSVGITGTTLILESKPDSYDRMIVLEGDARFSLNNFPAQSTQVYAGQLLNVRAGARKLPKPGRVDLRRIVNTHPLIKNFPPLPSLDLILAVTGGGKPNRPPLQPQPQPSIPVTGPGAPSPVYVPTGPTGPSFYWGCVNGQVVQMTSADCQKSGNQCYRSREEAAKACEARGKCWCCIDTANGMNVVQMTKDECQNGGGQCYGSRKEALRNCRGKGQTPTPTPHERPTPRPTPRPTIKPTPKPTPKKPVSTGTPTTIRKFPVRKKSTPTPTPVQIR
jgi:hypothetical protein